MSLTVEVSVGAAGPGWKLLVWGPSLSEESSNLKWKKNLVPFLYVVAFFLFLN